MEDEPKGLIPKVHESVVELERRVDEANLQTMDDVAALLRDLGIAQQVNATVGFDMEAARLSVARDTLLVKLGAVLPAGRGNRQPGPPVPKQLKQQVHTNRSDWGDTPETDREEIRRTCVLKGEPLTRVLRRKARSATDKAAKVAARAAARAEALRTARADPRLHVSDIASLASKIDPGSIDAIVTDPPYGPEFSSLYGDLGRLAVHALKPGGLLLTFFGRVDLSHLRLLDDVDGIDWRWMVAYAMPSGPVDGVPFNARSKVHQQKVTAEWKPLAAFTRAGGPILRDQYSTDLVIPPAVNARHKHEQTATHHWGQNVGGMRRLINEWCRPGWTLLDPFCGGGSMLVAAQAEGLHVAGADIDPANVELTRRALEAAAVDGADDDGAPPADDGAGADDAATGAAA